MASSNASEPVSQCSACRLGRVAVRPNPKSKIENPKSVFNLPNQITLFRLVLALAFFVLLAYHWHEAALAAFVLGAVTDFLDGYVARKKGMTSDFGRIADPSVDKVLLSGAFIYLTAKIPETVPVWAVIVIVAREYLVTSLRGYAESKGIQFKVSVCGQSKTLVQFVTVSAGLGFLFYLRESAWASMTMSGLVWITVLVTVFSGLEYFVRSAALLRTRLDS